MVNLTMFEDELMFSPLQKKLLRLLESNGPMTRRELVKRVGNPRTTVYDNLRRLIDFNLVRKFSRPVNCRGRPLVFFKLAS